MVGMKKQLKKLTKLFKRHQKSLRRRGVPALVLLAVFFAGMVTQVVWQARKQPSNLVWGVDSSVKVPKDLKNMLLARDDCKDYRSFGSQRGVGLWAVVQIEQDRFAKISHGCSWAINNQTLAVKQSSGWQIVTSLEYFSDTAQGVPTCTAVIKYKVPIGLEGFCLNDKAQLVKNPNP